MAVIITSFTPLIVRFFVSVNMSEWLLKSFSNCDIYFKEDELLLFLVLVLLLVMNSLHMFNDNQPCSFWCGFNK